MNTVFDIGKLSHAEKLRAMEELWSDLTRNADDYPSPDWHGKVLREREDQGEGLGEYFEDALSADIDSLRLYAGIHAKVCGYYRMLASKFPFAVYYDVVENHVRVRAILDCRRDPKRIRARLRD